MRAPIPIPKRSPWTRQFLVLRALLHREAATRFGQSKLGFVWALVEPLTGVLVIGLLIGSIAGRTVPEIPYAYFVLNGMLLLKLFTGPMSSGLKGLDSNQGLLVYPTVRPLDPILARLIFQLLNTLLAFGVFCVAGLWMGIDFSLMNLHYLLACYLLTWLAGSGTGLILGVASAYYSDVDKIIPVIQRPLLLISAVMFPMSALPDSVKATLLLNPLVHTIELSRHALFPLYHAEGANLSYPTVFAIITVSIGLTLFRINEQFLSTR